MGGFDALAVQFDPVSAKRKGDQFELVCQWFLRNDPTYQPLLRRVWLWREWPDRWSDTEAGIDLVAEDHDGKLWAIQAKAYDPAYSISKADINKFVSESSRAGFSYRLLIGTTDKRHHIASRLMDDLGIPFIGLTQLRDADDYLDWPATPTALRPSKPLTAKKPRAYQKPAITDVVKRFKTADRGQLIMACGTGKTLTAWFITEKLAAERTLVLVPSLSLLKQTMREWQTANPKKPFATLPVCSDETVGGLGEDAAVSHISDLGVPVTTDPVKIAEFLRNRSGPRVVFSTYQSSPQIAAAFALGRVPAFDLIVADEAHRVAGPVSSDFATVLDAEAIKAKRRLFMTATPRFFTGRVLKEAKQADYEVASMDDETKFGGVFHRLSFAEAIDRDLLTDYQVAIIGVDDATYRDWAERGTLVALDGSKRTDARSLAGQIGLAKAMRKFDLRRVISFHSRVKASRDFAASMPAVLDWMPARQRPKGELWSRYASGEMPAGERAALIGHLKRLDDEQRGLLTNARCLAEGVDVPALDGVAFIDPRRSEVDIVQAVGRAIRKLESKTVGTIVIPVFIDTDEDAEVALNSSVFKPVWDVIKALRAHDTVLGEELDTLRREMGRKGGVPRLPGKIYVDIPATVSKNFADAFDARIIEEVTSSWEYAFGLIQQFVDQHGHALVPRTCKMDGFSLGAWVNGQRNRYASGTLLPEREARLEHLPGWSWNVIDAKWEEGFTHLLRYVRAHHTSRVPYPYRDPDGYPLGGWVSNQRMRYSRKTLPAERVERLRVLPDWSWDIYGEAWEESYRLLVEYIGQHGHADVPIRGTFKGIKLGQWVNLQRDRYTKGKLEENRIALLEKLGVWKWDPLDSQWESAFNELTAYTEQHGTSLVPRGHVTESGLRLGSWVTMQRVRNSDGVLDPGRRERLERLAGWSWKPIEEKWGYGFQRLTNYLSREGQVPSIDYVDEDGFSVGLWAKIQRREYGKGKMPPDRQARLEALDGWYWDTYAARFEEGLGHLLAFADRNGHARVPQSYATANGFRLGVWVDTLRQRYRKGILSAEHQARLASMPGWLWDASSLRGRRRSER